MANGDEGQQGGEGGGQIQGFREVEQADTGPTIEDAIQEMTAGEAGAATAAPEAPAEPEGGEPAPEGGEPAPEAGEAPAGEGEGLPDGFTDEGDRVRGPDGRFYAREDVLEQGSDAEPLPTEEEAEDFFEGEDEGEEPEHSVEIELEAEEGEEPEVVEIATDDPEVAEQIQQMQADAREVREVRSQIAELEETRAEVQQDLEQARLLEEEIRMDPSGFVVEKLPDERKAEVVEDILLESDEIFDRVQQLVDDWTADRTARREKRLERREERQERRKQFEQRRDKIRAAREASQEIVSTLEAQVPPDMSSRRAQMFLEDAVRDVEEHLRSQDKPLQQFDMDRLPELIERRLEIYGIEWTEGGKATTNGRGSSEPRTARPGGEEEAAKARKAEEARKTGERLRKAYARRKKAGQSAPAGQGSPGTTTRPPSDATLDDALDSLRQRVAE